MNDMQSSPRTSRSESDHSRPGSTAAAWVLLVSVFVLPATAVAQSTPSPDVNIRGETHDDGFGAAVAAVGDLDGDGITDFAFAAPGDDDVDVDAGEVYVLYGPLGGGDSASQADATILGEAIVDGLGRSVTGVGDVDGDHRDDLLVTSRSNDAGGIQAGRAYLFHGPLAGQYAATEADAIITGDEYDELGWSSAAAGDVNGDGFADFIIGAHAADLVGQAHLFLGPVSGDLGVADAAATIDGIVFSEDLGEAVASGDLNGDAVPDVIVGAPRPPIEGNDTGRVYVFFSSVAGELPASAADVIVQGEQINDEFGSAVAAGDLDGDGQEDLVVGAFQRFNDGPGRVYVFHGPLAGTISAAAADAILIGETFDEGGEFGHALATFGTGRAKLAVGAPYAGANGIRSGRVYVFRGVLHGTVPASAADRVIDGSHYDFLGASLASAGDHDGDGSADLLIGAPQFDSPNDFGYAGLFLDAAPTAVTNPLPPGIALRGYPNPSPGPVNLRLALAQAGPASVVIYDLLGRRVRTVYEGGLPADATTLAWDGRDDDGRHVPAGVYLVDVRTGTREVTRRLDIAR